MHNLSSITPLGATEPRVETHGSVTCSEVTDLALASVSARLGQESACSDKMHTLLGQPAPGPGKSAMGDPFTAVWMGPDQWMIGANISTHEDIEEQLISELKTTASVTEQTDSWCCFDLSGTRVAAVMELLCNVNLRVMKAGDATRSSIHHLNCFVICGDPDGFIRLIGPRSSAGSLHHAIIAAMKSVA